MLARVKQIDDLHCARKVLIGKIPDPLGPVADHHLLRGTVPATIPGLCIEALAKGFGGFDRAGVGGGIGVAKGVALFILACLCEYAS